MTTGRTHRQGRLCEGFAVAKENRVVVILLLSIKLDFWGIRKESADSCTLFFCSAWLWDIQEQFEQCRTINLNTAYIIKTG